MRKIGSVPAPGSAWRSAAASSKRLAAPSPPATARIARAPFSPFGCPPFTRRWRPWRPASMAKGPKVLIVDDEPPIRRFLRTSLSAQGYTIVEGETGAEALSEAAREKPDILVLDLGLPDMNGTDVIRAIRKTSDVPIIVLSVRSDEHGKVEALDLGADDYVTKPFGMDELVARIRLALRHRYQAKGEPPIFVSGDLSVDLVRRNVQRGGIEVKLSPKEYDLLKILVTNAGKVLTHRHILTDVWGPAHTEDAQYLRVFIRNLRHKLEADPAQPKLILTESGVGYRLQAPMEAPEAT